MKTEKQIRRAAKLLGDAARAASAEGDHETYEVCANIAMALQWAADGQPDLVKVTDDLIKQAALSVQNPARN